MTSTSNWPRVNGNVSFWMDQLGPVTRRPALPGDTTVDVAIVGAGFTGLWTAYYLLHHDPSLQVALLEREYAGYGASGRNGGWLSAEPPGQMRRYATARGEAATRALHQEMTRTVTEVIRVAEQEGIEADIAHDGLLYVATNPAQLKRLRDRFEEHQHWGWTPADQQLLSVGEVAQRVRVAGALGAFHTRHAARIQPAKLVRGLAEVVERMGAKIYEDTEVVSFAPRQVRTDRGEVRARHVIIALEGYLSRITGYARRMLPMNSSMIITEPLPAPIWEEVGWAGAETLGDAAHSFTYIQRTADDRIALGGRGVPLDFANQFNWDGAIRDRAVRQLLARLHHLFPATAQVATAHSWTGVLGVPRDWSATVRYDPDTGLGMAGGYVGHGVAATNLAGRTLAALLTGADSSDLVDLAWVGRALTRWEPEPLRYLGAKLLYRVYGVADAAEQRSGSARPCALAVAADRVTGRQ